MDGCVDHYVCPCVAGARSPFADMGPIKARGLRSFQSHTFVRFRPFCSLPSSFVVVGLYVCLTRGGLNGYCVLLVGAVCYA